MASAVSVDGGCYLVYESDSSGRLVQHYSKTPVPHAIGFWCAGQDKKIQGFKFTQNLGRSELIRNCAAGNEGRKNYYSGWCQFVKAAKLMKGSVKKIATDESTQCLEVDVYLYYKEGDKVIKLEDGVLIDASNMDAVACVPKNCDIFGNLTKMDEGMFLHKCSESGASSKCM
mmetsp:Transcript_20023/g.28498  ORF Transcript_20023/g.28498 Transcript_20023/m.28498 type:complete len:172 (+) Transcript_20023:291-806(+)|eukprot:CAMPEP_0172426166 /NCGR_PEP_ID=MMETSP1064-20121228/36089_1 /TAXON_ID=202472 /ORGANISM="Aulacoseira subarctica , Strain CCAP 1002/5" /LENGTH=171 /DNA_ID=CAMNT_0013169589 /DNA_START=228 /DNA_END=743 /DNA_ORIENTATION=+